MALSLKLDKIYNNNSHGQIFNAVVDNLKGFFNSLYTALYLMTIIFILSHWLGLELILPEEEKSGHHCDTFELLVEN